MSIVQAPNKPGPGAASAPLVSVIIPTMNRPELLALALESLCRQTFGDFEAVIVNDGGKDPLPAIEPFAGRLDIRYLCHETNQGVSAARNTGLRAARGRYIAYLDDDDCYYENHLETLLDTIRKSHAAVAHTDAKITFLYQKSGPLGMVFNGEMVLSEEADPQKLLRKNIFPMLCVMHEKRCLDEVGYFREYLKVFEDWDFCMRLSRFHRFAYRACVIGEYVWRKGNDNLENVIDLHNALTAWRQESDDPNDFTELHGILTAWREGGDALSQDKKRMDVVRAYLSRIGTWLAQIPRVEELRERVADAVTVCRAPEAAYTLSVIVHMTGATPALGACFEALGNALPDPEHTEIILIADGDAELARTLAEFAVGRMSLIGHPRPLGRALAHNHAAGLARGQRLLFLSPDVALAPNAIAAMLAVDAEHGGKAIVTPRLRADRAGAENCCGGRVDAAGEIHLVREADAGAANWMRVDCAPAACLLLPAGVFADLGGFRPRYAPVFFEDADFCLRARDEAGLPTLCALEAAAVLRAVPGEEAGRPEARVNAVSFAADWGKPSGLTYPSTEWAAPFCLSS
ncbi:MAG: glycosyltransferase family 2 protein [Candidatus Accumulibacter sp.]|jgi:glycosyltransferase involved in cell wall biosynthesis|nr:glycosyltransferase family 2 protein [Accumulibacter sp.]